MKYVWSAAGLVMVGSSILLGNGTELGFVLFFFNCFDQILNNQIVRCDTQKNVCLITLSPPPPPFLVHSESNMAISEVLEVCTLEYVCTRG